MHKKSELLQSVQPYELTPDNSVSKTQIKEVALKYLTDEDIILCMETDISSVGGMAEELLQLKRLEFEEKEKSSYRIGKAKGNFFR